MFFAWNKGRCVYRNYSRAYTSPSEENLIILTGKNATINAPNLINTLNYDDNLQIISAEYIGARRWNLIIKDRLKVKLPEKDYFSAIKNLNKLIYDIDL